NASEWCQDAWNNKALGSTAVMDPVVTGTVASDRVLRPGSYGSLLRYNAAAYRWGTASTNRYGDSGVRCVRTVLFP
ncbi:MAG: hypothetical protein KAI47_18275, partial [Deltaproteobacteria bacterium]|nr:hypothetical protein [Deltaproteobacteria bacterium]